MDMKDEDTVYDDKSYGRLYKCGITPEIITTLKPNEIFVFGSNLQGRHGGGAARKALNHFGAIFGQGVGLQGQSYAIPTMQGPTYTIRRYVDDFIKFAKENPRLHFLVTKIGCGIAGFTPEQIAPLFRDAIDLSNVSLPIEFIQYILSHPLVPSHVIKKVHGQTRTLVDMLCELNKEHHFRTPREALNSITNYVKRLKEGPDSIAWNFSLRSLYAFTPRCMTKNGLDIEHLQDMMEDLFADQIVGIEEIYKHYVIEKTIKMVEMLNEFRRYTDPQQLTEDLWKIGVGANHCGPNPKDYYYAFGSPGGIENYIFYFFERNTVEFWKEFAPNGFLDNELYKEFMYRRHGRGIEKYGLEAVIRRNYKADGPCHAEVYFPYRGGAAPVYVDEMLLAEDMTETASRRLIKSCGEGKGLNSLENIFEFERMRPLIEQDPKYIFLDKQGYRQSLYVPKDDVTLPLYDRYSGKVAFDSKESKEKTIRGLWSKYPEIFSNQK